ncbi:MAG: 4-(cytidine 5'-diphospho)-2-C-methyl-D-erythritol kinase [Psychrilyobacter sp.]|nr:4-(cytidine 5'-diphospho)-2-C-methyl-D-erythritol kinase [Psychrilyobacter sp.]
MIVEIESNGKINLGLNITGKTNRGYHLLDMIMVPISLSDKMVINFKGKAGDLKIETNKKEIPVGKENIIYKIYDLFYKETGIEKQEIELYLEKNIPSQAGLGGGSSNGAFFFNELNKHYKMPISLKRALEITKNIGADIPFFIINKSSRVKGIGEEIEVIENRINNKIILVKPSFGVSTVVAYKNYSRLKEKKDANIDKIIETMRFWNKDNLDNLVENQLEQSLLLEDKNIIEFRNRINEIKDVKFHMSGSGSCYFTVVEEKQQNTIYEKLKVELEDCEILVCDFLN